MANLECCGCSYPPTHCTHSPATQTNTAITLTNGMYMQVLILISFTCYLMFRLVQMHLQKTTSHTIINNVLVYLVVSTLALSVLCNLVLQSRINNYLSFFQVYCKACDLGNDVSFIFPINAVLFKFQKSKKFLSL